MKPYICAVAIASVLMIVSGCTKDLFGTTYSQDEARQIQKVQFGTIEEVRPVKLEGEQGGVGALAGGAIGGIAAGSNIGGGSGSSIASIIGAVAGGIVGNMAEKKLTEKQGVELTVKLDNGSKVSVVQQADPNEVFVKGNRVKVLSQGSTSRVVKEQ
ncbi:hypothetical protein [Candidatus Sororendozoicomonas aggregata]|uniref:outer membrane lipoprotein n=1 Tax=Candidatus Sororendozoicomonas aggregata TaxID=3073239 RepID=UPI002ED0EBA0